jgi:isoamylase
MSLHDRSSTAIMRDFAPVAPTLAQPSLVREGLPFPCGTTWEGSGINMLNLVSNGFSLYDFSLACALLLSRFRR